jgi:hypothetical protein
MIAHAPPPRTVDLVALIGRDVPLRRQSRQEYSGPCPLCGGVDRLHVSAEGWWFCRQCSPRRGDAPGYLMWKEGIGYRAALAQLEGLPPMQPLRTEPIKELTDQQRAAFLEIADTCHERLADQEKPLRWLASRGIAGNPVVDFRLGYNPGRPGDTTAIAGCRVPCGMVIPLWGVDGRIHGISVRRSAKPAQWPEGKDWRYQQVSDSRVPLYGLPAKHSGAMVLVEGYLDAVLLAHLAGDLVDVAALGSAKASVDSQWYGYLLAHGAWVVAMDADEAGRKAARGWKDWSGRVTLVEQLNGTKDPTEAWQPIAITASKQEADSALRAWVIAALLDAGCE